MTSSAEKSASMRLASKVDKLRLKNRGLAFAFEHFGGAGESKR